jgi:uncharacterized protein
MNTSSGESLPRGNSRVELVDVLRGSALAGILLLHSIEHWDITRNPQNPPDWLKPFNTWSYDTGFFLFGGKAYAVFALMFGVSFFFIFNGWSKHGVNFEGRFLWRLTVLAFFGYLNGIVYCGDFLLVIAILGLPLVFLHRLGNRALVWISVLLVLQIPSLWQVSRIFYESGYQVPRPHHWDVYRQLGRIHTEGSFVDVVKTNLWFGQSARLLWTFETGRYTQMIGLFVWGLLLGRSHVFKDPARRVRLAVWALIVGAIGFAVFYPIKLQVPEWGLRGANRSVAANLISAYCNLSQLAIWVGTLVLLYQWARGRKMLRLLAPFGRMSLSNYVVQGMVGMPLFYGFGLALFRYMGPFYSVCLGAVMLVAQIAFSHFWLKRFHYGPLEWLWRAFTFWSFTMPMRKTVAAPSHNVIDIPLSVT